MGTADTSGRGTTPQTIGALLSNQLYAGIVDVPEFGVREKRGDFEPLVSEDVFHRVQAIIPGRMPTTAPRVRSHPDFPLRNFVSCVTCGRRLTGSWSKGRSSYYAYYHCRPGCSAVHVTKARLESLFTNELARLQPSPGYMRLLKESVLQIWKAGKAAVQADLANAERQATEIQKRFDRLDETFLFERSIDIDVYDRHSEKLRQELTLLRMDRHASEIDELTSKASWHSPSASCRARPTSGCRRHSTSASGSNSCSFRKESRSTDAISFEPPQPRRLQLLAAGRGGK